MNDLPRILIMWTQMLTTSTRVHLATSSGSVLELLGLGHLVMSIDSDIDVVDLIERGPPKKYVGRLIYRIGFTPLEVASALPITQRTLLRWLSCSQGNHLLTPSQSSQLWLLVVVFVQAVYALGTERLALDWLRRGQVGLNQRRPLELASNPIGLNEVRRLLYRIDHGVYV